MMFDLRRIAPLASLVAMLATLAGCDTLDFALPGAAASAPPQRALDYRNDDLSSLVFALDVPTSLRPVPNGTVLTFAATTSKAERHLKANLVLADGDAVDGALPPPAAGRTYYLLGFGDKDKAAFRETQQWLRTLPPDAAPVTALNIVPRLCAMGQVDPATTKIAVLAALPGAPALLPLVASEPLATLLIDTGTSLKPCGG